MIRTPNKSQQEAIEWTDGPLLIIAGPGSGKTFTLVERIVHLIKSKAATPESLLVLTFTDKAARELSTRVSNRLTEEGVPFNIHEMYLGTFHSVCLRLLEDNREFTRLKRNYTMLDQFDQQYFLYRKLEEFRGLEGSELVIGAKQSPRWTQAETLLKALNTVSEEALSLESLQLAPDPEVRALAALFEKYQQLLAETNSLDFSGIQFEALHLLLKHPSVREELRTKFTHIMVDEFQDTNTIQERILRLLANGRQNLCVVGDDDQGLYRFRGATIRNILEFPSQYPKGVCKQVRLVTNYRSHPGIISFYNGWMNRLDWTDQGKSFRFEKSIEPRAGDFLRTATVVRLSASDAHGDQAWFEENLNLLRSLKESGKLEDWNQVAFLFRSVTNAHVVGLANYLESQGIPVYSPRSNLFFERPEIKWMIGALIFLFPQFQTARKWQENASLDIWDWYDNTCFAAFAEEVRKPGNADLLQWARRKAKEHLVLSKNTDYAFTGLFYQLLQFPLFNRFLEEDALSGVDKGRAARNLAELSSLLGRFEYLHHINILRPDFLEKNLRSLFNQFFRFLKDGGVGEYEDEAEYAPTGCVSFLTVHQSKGLEFPVVICGSMESVPRNQVAGVEQTLHDGGYLSRPAFEPLARVKEFDFWRLFYTAFSRAQNLLVLTARLHQGQGRSPSKYFQTVFDALPDWRSDKFQPALLTFEPVKEIVLKKEYSFTSHITLFENCAEQYRFFKELEFQPVRSGAQLFGTLVHQSIEDIHKAVLRGESQIVNPERILDWISGNYAWLSRHEGQYLAPNTLRAVERHVLAYYEREKNQWERIQHAEVDVSLVKDTYILKGSVDLIRGEDGCVELVDFKSEKKPDLERDREKILRYRRQLEVYAHLVEERMGVKVSKIHLYYTGEESGNPYLSWPKDARSIGQTVASFDNVVQRIQAKDYVMPCRPGKMCENCDMHHFCDARNWKFRNA